MTETNVVEFEHSDFTVSLRRIKIPVDQALKQVLVAHDLESKREGNVIKIYQKEDGSRKNLNKIKVYSGHVISIQACDVKISTIINGLEMATRQQIKEKISVPDADKRLSFRLIDIPWDQFLDIIKESPSQKPLARICSNQPSSSLQGTIYIDYEKVSERYVLVDGSETWVLVNSPKNSNVDFRAAGAATGSVFIYDASGVNQTGEYIWHGETWRMNKGFNRESVY